MVDLHKAALRGPSPLVDILV